MSKTFTKEELIQMTIEFVSLFALPIADSSENDPVFRSLTTDLRLQYLGIDTFFNRYNTTLDDYEKQCNDNGVDVVCIDDPKRMKDDDADQV